MKRYIAVCCALVAVVLCAALVGCSAHEDDNLPNPTEIIEPEPSNEVTVGEGDSDQVSGMDNYSSVAGRSPEVQAAEEAVQELVSPYGDSVSVSMMPLDGSEGFDIGGSRQFASASMIKLLVLACLMDRVDDGSLSPAQTYELNSKDIVGGTGHINAMPLGTELSYSELAESMIAYSDNTATNVLIDALGMDSVNEEADALGLDATVLQRKMMDFGGAENYMSANDAATILKKFADGAIGSAETSEQAIGYLSAQADNDALSRGIPGEIAFAHKTGTLDKVRHDGGIVYAEKPYILVVFTALGTAEANNLMANISSVAYSAMES